MSNTPERGVVALLTAQALTFGVMLALVVIPANALFLDASLDDRVEVRLDSALLHEHLAGRHALLHRAFRDRGEHAARDAREELDAVQGGNPVDECERSRRCLREVRHGRET